ncbi:MAG TPA: 4Fe-4S binding protein [Methanomassiliicoccales archaeon]|nr:4Fe-4S binding protein [Methanomassiliicoccales archaeon]
MSADLRRKIVERCREWGIEMVGFASADDWDDPPFEPWPPKQFRPKAIFPGCRTVIVMALPVTLPILETSPSIWYQELYKNLNAQLDERAYQLSEMLNRMGYASAYVPRDGYGTVELLKDNPYAFFSHRHAAYLAGLGTFGLNNMLLTREHGPRQRFVSVFTQAEIPPGKPMDKQLCVRCMRCVKACPVQAIGDVEYPKASIDKVKCTGRSVELKKRYRSPCGICIKVCPVGEDRKLFKRKDMGLYDGPDKDPELYEAREHVRKYGST